MIRHTRMLAIVALTITSIARGADPENLGARPYVEPRPSRGGIDSDGPPIGRDDSLLRRGDLRILDPGPDPLDPPPRSRESWQRLVERDLDRVMGRIEPEEVFQLRRIDQDRARLLSRPESRREFERFQEERDRTLRLDERASDQARAVERRRVVERESERLKAERERFQRAMNTDTTYQGVAHDTRRLAEMKQSLDASLARIATERASALSALDADPALTPEQRAARRAETGQRFDRLRDERIESYESDRSRITGFPRERKGGR